LLIGSSGALAVYFGKDRLFGLQLAASNGLACTDVNLVSIRKQNQFWIRKYIRTDQTDGLTRVRTALRVAQAVYEEQKPDLVQVVVLDKNGPTLRSDIRGRALGADVVYIPHPAKVADGTVEAPVTARYFSGAASNQGLFYGEQIDMTPSDIHAAIAALKDHSDCDNALAAENGAGNAKKDKLKAAENAEQKAMEHAARDEKSAAPPEQQAPAATGNVPTTEFIGADATGGNAPAPAGLDPTMTGASERKSPVTN
jgi:hypothetical protein